MTSTKAANKDQGSFDIKLAGAEQGKVVTRFPPEPSGYLHIGHAKAVLLNEYFARHYNGQMIVRFDDTNALKEKEEYEQSILEDLALLGVKGDRLTYTSDYFDYLIDMAFKLIDKGLAYADDTPQDEMRMQRGLGEPSLRRETSVEENKRIFAEMIEGKEEAQIFCLRAKMSVDDNNKAMRDPVIYRCQKNVPHHRTGMKYLVYPTYDFACPLVDSLEGVTHALRTNEYRDRNSQYAWFCQALDVRAPHIWDYSRLNFVYTLLSKRKLTQFVEQKRVSGWDDPRFPTIRGILRRGLSLKALRDYILMQGPSKNTILLEWDKVWTLNKKEIDPIAPRYSGLLQPTVSLQLSGDFSESLCELSLSEDPKVEYFWKDIPLHPKNSDIGMKKVLFSKRLLLAESDAKDLVVGEEITLMKWGNVIIREVSPTLIKAELHLEGDYKLTQKKLTWLADCNDGEGELVSLKIHDYDYLITKKKIEENDKLEDFLTPTTEFITNAIGEAALKNVKKGDFLQLERIGYFICDEAFPNLNLIMIPDGKASSISSKHQA